MMFEKNDPKQALRYFSDKMTFTTGPVELSRMLGDSSVVIVDVRAAKDYEEARVPGSINLPKDSWNKLAGLSKDKLYVLLCYSHVCHLAATAAIEFARAGLSVMECDGGFKSWKENNLPIDSGASEKREGPRGAASA